MMAQTAGSWSHQNCTNTYHYPKAIWAFNLTTPIIYQYYGRHRIPLCLVLSQQYNRNPREISYLHSIRIIRTSTCAQPLDCFLDVFRQFVSLSPGFEIPCGLALWLGSLWLFRSPLRISLLPALPFLQSPRDFSSLSSSRRCFPSSFFSKAFLE